VKRWLSITLFAVATVATTVKPMSIEKLTRASSDVVLARAESQWVEWNDKHTLMHTYTRFRVARAIKGGAAQTFTVRQMGGRADGFEQKIVGVRSWRVGEKAVLFLRPSQEQPGSHIVTGLMQGDFRLVRERGETYVTNGVAGVEAVSDSGKRESFAGARLTLQELERRVRAVGRAGVRVE
jgi:hypothetical protein